MKLAGETKFDDRVRRAANIVGNIYGYMHNSFSFVHYPSANFPSAVGIAPLYFTVLAMI